MPDSAPTAPEPTAAAPAAPDAASPEPASPEPASPEPANEPDGRLVRRVRWQLIAWSAGSTFAVLLVLGGILYAAVATTLASASENLLRDRAGLFVGSSATTVTGSTPFTGPTTVTGGTPVMQGQDGVATGAADGPGAPGVGLVGGGSGALAVVTSSNAAQPGFAIDGPYAGTLAVIVPATGFAGAQPVAVGSGEVNVSAAPVDVTGAAGGAGPPDPAGYAAAQAGQTTLHEITWQGSPVRVLSVVLPAPVPAATGGGLQVIGDRTAELRTLAVLLAVLLGGGLVALAVSALVGSLYATRALVPIRASLRRQREFAADTSHELRTPLAVIRAGVARVRQQPEARVAEVLPTLVSVDAEAVRLGALVDDLLALARTDAGSADLDLRRVDLADIAADALAALEPMAAASGTRLVLDVEPAPMTGDAERLRRLVTVLVDNAVRHGRAGGSVQVTIRAGRLVVDDDGPGIPAGDRARVFDRFWRGAGTTAGGSGLGLSIAAWIVERHGGQIEVGTSPSGGARFSISLPTG